MILIPVLLLAILVVLAGLFMLAKAKKEQLGRTYVIASTVAAGFGVLVFIFGLTAGILMACFHHKCGGNMKCKSESSCPMMQGGGMGHCSKMMGAHGGCPMMNGGSDCKMMGAHGSCSMMSGHGQCEMGGKCSMKTMGGKCEMMEMESDDAVVKDIVVKKLGNGENGAEIKVEVEKKSK